MAVLLKVDIGPLEKGGGIKQQQIDPAIKIEYWEGENHHHHIGVSPQNGYINSLEGGLLCAENRFI